MDDKDFIDVSDDVETLSFDDEISDEIDAMLSQIMPEEKKPSSNYEILKDEKVTNKNSLDVYVPSIKDFNIKSERTHKIVKKVMIYSIIFILFTFEFFINKAGTELNNLRIYATNNNPIMIVQNNKYGFIDDKGSVSALIGLLELLKREDIKPKYKTKIFISVYEEVGHGASYLPEDITEFIAVDMGCIGDDLSCTEYDVSICAKDSGGPYDYKITSDLIELAKNNNLSYAVDIYPRYGSDVGAALRGGNNIKGGLIGP